MTNPPTSLLDFIRRRVGVGKLTGYRSEFSPSKRLTNTNAAFMIINPLTPISDQERISPYNIKQTNNEIKEKS